VTVQVSERDWGTKKRGRYNAVPSEERTFGGTVFGSKAEMRRGAELILMVAAGEISDLRWHPEFEVNIGGQPYCRYTADSSYWRKGRFVVEEVKSEATRRDPAYRLRRKAAELYCGFKVVEYIA